MENTTYSPIDAVITWVDGDDPKHQAKMDQALQGKSRKHIPGAEKTRFGNANELQYSILSILRFAPFVRYIFIVTDEQTPDVHTIVEQYFPDRIQDIRIVDHKEIFRDHLEFLPTFNSRSIEALLWKIKDISDHFFFLSDDMFLIRPTKPTDFFVDNQPVMRGTWLLRPVLRNAWNRLRTLVQHRLLSNREFQPKPSFHVGQWNAANILGFQSRYFFSSHTPHTIDKKAVEAYFAQYPEVLINQIKHPFRHNSQFNCAAFYYHLSIREGNQLFSKPSFIFLHPVGRNKRYIDKKLRKAETTDDAIFMNVQSLELCTIEEQTKIIQWMKKNLSLTA
ncbi:MAG: Stealth CR1 domain-containing protein [Mongoliitalea sp.]